MIKNKQFVIGGAGLLAVVMLVGAGFMLGHRRHGSSVQSAYGAESINSSTSTEAAATGAAGSGVIPLNQKPKPAASSGGLSVSSGSSANKLGQIAPTGNASAQSGGSAQASSGGGGSSKAAAIDPSTFALRK